MRDESCGGPAFPQVHDMGEDGECHYYGMTLRDYFAAKAMQAMLSNPTCETPYDAVVVCAFQVSDAMLAERDK